MGICILVADGNEADVRRRMVDIVGATPGESYAAVLAGLAPDARVDICCPADPDARLPAPLDSYDGVAVTGSALNIHRREPASLRQIDFAREVFGRGIPMFGSCWGLQLATVAAGGEVAANPRGREVGFARKITLTEAGRGHPMHAGRTLAFDAPAIHADEVVRLPADAVVTAGNALSVVQAAEIRHGKGVFWGVQYHPEYGLSDVAAILRRYGQRLLEERFFATTADLERYVDDLTELAGDADRSDIAWRLGLGTEVLRSAERTVELANWINRQVRAGPRFAETGQAGSR